MIDSNTTTVAWTTHIHNMHSPRAQCAQDRASSKYTVNTDTVLTTYTVSPSRPDGNIHDPTCAAKFTLVPGRRLSLSLNDKPRFTAQVPTTHERNDAKSMTLEEDDQNHHAPTRLYTMFVIRTQVHDQKYCRNTRNERHGNPNVTDKHELPSTDVPALLTCTTHIHTFTLEFQTSQLPNMVALPCTCHTCTCCAHAFMNVKTACVTSIKSLSHLAKGSSLLRSVRRSVRLKCENE